MQTKKVRRISVKACLTLQKRNARAAYDKTPSVENYVRWIQAVNACKLAK